MPHFHGTTISRSFMRQTTNTGRARRAPTGAMEILGSQCAPTRKKRNRFRERRLLILPSRRSKTFQTIVFSTEKFFTPKHFSWKKMFGQSFLFGWIFFRPKHFSADFICGRRFFWAKKCSGNFVCSAETKLDECFVGHTFFSANLFFGQKYFGHKEFQPESA